MTCTYCGAPDHSINRRPWKDAMRTVIVIVSALLLTACAGLSVNFDAAVSYRSDVPLGQRKP